jgi:hypothetical protein
MNRCLMAIASLSISAATLLSGCSSGNVAPTVGSVSTDTPSGLVRASVTTIAFSGTGTQTFTVSESGYSGSFTATSSNTAVVTVAQTSPSTFTVTSIGGGTATITVTDQQGNSATLSVTVATVTFNPQSHS